MIKILVLIMLVAGCGESKLEKDKLVIDNAWVGGKLLPSKAKDKMYLGNGWFSFSLFR